MPRVPAKPREEPFVQTIEMVASDGTLIGRGVWRVGGTNDGVLQVVELQIKPPFRTAGNGTRLMKQMIQQGGTLCARRGCRVRRVWIGVEQKTQIEARGFLTDLGFHHVATVTELYRGQDLLIYQKALD
jgi:GNAT superfamily N-acetyltransferase